MKQERQSFVALLVSLVGSAVLVVLSDPGLRRGLSDWWNRTINTVPAHVRDDHHVYGVAREAESYLKGREERRT